jgi:hypothetical protein
MKLLLSLLLVGMALPTFGATTNSELSVGIAVPYSRNTLAAFGIFNDTNDTRVISQALRSTFHVLLRNISNKAQNIWEDGSPRINYSLSFEMRDESGKKWTAKKIPFETGLFNGSMHPTFCPLKRMRLTGARRVPDVMCAAWHPSGF